MTTIDMQDAEARKHLRARTIIAHLKLHEAGMRHSQLSARQILDAATELTDIKYKRGQYGVAREHLDKLFPKIKKPE